MYRRENIDRRIADLRQMLATADDQLELALLTMAIESFETERDALVNAGHKPAAEEATPVISSRDP